MVGLVILLPFLLIFVVMIVLILVFSDRSKPKQYGVTSVTQKGALEKKELQITSTERKYGTCMKKR
jgi:uncharacterized protein YpmS